MRKHDLDNVRESAGVVVAVESVPEDFENWWRLFLGLRVEWSSRRL